MNLQSSSINMFLLNDMETLMQIFTFLSFLKKATNDWVTKNITRQIYNCRIGLPRLHV